MKQGVFADSSASSMAEILRGFDKMPQPEAGKTYDFTLAAVKAFSTTAKKVVFSVKDIEAFEADVLLERKATIQDDVATRSLAFGEAVADAIIERLSNDNYKETRGWNALK
ncbi:MAG: hypothetical protein HC817_15115 [Saprospiraceae bacterium]|nr:hypothetical protein [Saprospiraceae bacterium]